MLRRADERDVEAIRLWRNQPANREVSVHSHVIDEAEHRAWWERTKDDPTRRVLVFEHDARPLGIVTFFDLDLDGGTRTGAWGFFLDHDTVTAEGTATTAWIQVMKEATAYAFEAAPDGLELDVLTGEVLAGNEAVRTMNRRFRFTEGDPEEREADGRRITVHPISLRREDRRGSRRKESRA